MQLQLKGYFSNLDGKIQNDDDTKYFAKDFSFIMFNNRTKDLGSYIYAVR